MHFILYVCTFVIRTGLLTKDKAKNSKFKPCLFPYIHDSLQFGTSFFTKSLNNPFKDHIQGSRLNQTWARQSFK